MSSAGTPASTVYTRDFDLGEWRVRPSLNRLERDGAVVQIEPKAMDVLVELAEHAGEVRSKRRLLRVVWGEAAFVTDDVLTQAIRGLRRALGDDAKEPRYIETIPRRGYRLIGEVKRAQGWSEVGGARVGHYRIVQRLGSGGMGVVYLAEDTHLKRTVALKFLPPEVADDPERLERFQREAEALASLDHPGIVKIFATERKGDQRFLVVEHVEGGTLAERIPDRGFGRRELVDLAVRLADAVAEAHEKGVIHRDLKPANIMLDRRGRPRILDFGLAKLKHGETVPGPGAPATASMTVGGELLGTYPYMSPEQVQGKAVDRRSDIFALGAILYEMATGRRPFGGDSAAAVMSAILRDDPAPVEEMRPELPVEWARIVGRCLAKEPEDRYQRARDLRNDLADLRRGVKAGRPPVASGAGRRPGRLGALLGGAAILLTVGVALVIRPWEEGASPQDGARPAITSLAVLPLENLSGDVTQDYFVDGMTDGLIADLSRLSGLRVVSRQSCMHYKDTQQTVPEIARELGVDAIVEGTVLRIGNQVRITTQLIRAEPETHLWAETYQREAQDVLALLGEVTREIAEEIQVVITPAERARLAVAHDVAPDALEAYLKGIRLLQNCDPEEVRKAGQYFREAVQVDASFAPAWAGLAQFDLYLESWALPREARELRIQAAQEADAALARALDLDPALSFAHEIEAMLQWWRNWDWKGAEAAFRRAIDLAPSSPSGHGWYGAFLASMGRCQEADRESRLARRLGPRSQSLLRLRGDVLYYCHRFEEALEEYERIMEILPGQVFALNRLGFTLVALDRPDEAIKVYQQLRTWDGHEELARSYEGKTLEEVNRMWLEVAKDPSSPMHYPYFIAKVWAQNRESEEVFKWLERSFEERSHPGGPQSWELTFLKVDPDFLYLHQDPRFQDLLRRMNLADSDPAVS